jgi:hypothetical protein
MLPQAPGIGERTGVGRNGERLVGGGRPESNPVFQQGRWTALVHGVVGLKPRPFRFLLDTENATRSGLDAPAGRGSSCRALRKTAIEESQWPIQPTRDGQAAPIAVSGSQFPQVQKANRPSAQSAANRSTFLFAAHRPTMLRFRCRHRRSRTLLPASHHRLELDQDTYHYRCGHS